MGLEFRTAMNKTPEAVTTASPAHIESDAHVSIVEKIRREMKNKKSLWNTVSQSIGENNLNKVFLVLESEITAGRMCLEDPRSAIISGIILQIYKHADHQIIFALSSQVQKAWGICQDVSLIESFMLESHPNYYLRAGQNS